MSDFDSRWQQLINTARAAESEAPALSDFQRSRLAVIGLAAMQRARTDETSWKGLAAAASLFFIISLGVAALAVSVVDGDTARRWTTAFTPRELPSTRFIPAPPRPPALASLAPAWSPRAVLAPLDEWLTGSSSAPENSP